MNIITVMFIVIIASGIIGVIISIRDHLKYRECSMYPYYGKAPHCHDKNRYLQKEEWPNNFEEDPDAKGLGIYYCPCKNKHCCGKKIIVPANKPLRTIDQGTGQTPRNSSV